MRIQTAYAIKCFTTITLTLTLTYISTNKPPDDPVVIATFSYLTAIHFLARKIIAHLFFLPIKTKIQSNNFLYCFRTHSTLIIFFFYDTLLLFQSPTPYLQQPVDMTQYHIFLLPLMFAINRYKLSLLPVVWQLVFKTQFNICVY